MHDLIYQLCPPPYNPLLSKFAFLYLSHWEIGYFMMPLKYLSILIWILLLLFSSANLIWAYFLLCDKCSKESVFLLYVFIFYLGWSKTCIFQRAASSIGGKRTLDSRQAFNQFSRTLYLIGILFKILLQFVLFIKLCMTVISHLFALEIIILCFL